ncbi:UNKNOWN [Stylonychia lemnae]|uniref:Uncharacterized protein n=1 Tax=Stylonychia lemnae TaxID=5949 RepID=A0A078ATX0_STYLE|nr:UNKNOWN [Stylonychia lemnae]|eukprot:CDW84293.1 UNKNOWN [Stylonychia lemnae]
MCDQSKIWLELISQASKSKQTGVSCNDNLLKSLYLGYAKMYDNFAPLVNLLILFKNVKQVTNFMTIFDNQKAFLDEKVMKDKFKMPLLEKFILRKILKYGVLDFNKEEDSQTHKIFIFQYSRYILTKKDQKNLQTLKNLKFLLSDQQDYVNKYALTKFYIASLNDMNKTNQQHKEVICQLNEIITNYHDLLPHRQTYYHFRDLIEEINIRSYLLDLDQLIAFENWALLNLHKNWPIFDLQFEHFKLQQNYYGKYNIKQQQKTQVNKKIRKSQLNQTIQNIKDQNLLQVEARRVKEKQFGSYQNNFEETHQALEKIQQNKNRSQYSSTKKQLISMKADINKRMKTCFDIVNYKVIGTNQLLFFGDFKDKEIQDIIVRFANRIHIDIQGALNNGIDLTDNLQYAIERLLISIIKGFKFQKEELDQSKSLQEGSLNLHLDWTNLFNSSIDCITDQKRHLLLIKFIETHFEGSDLLMHMKLVKIVHQNLNLLEMEIKVQNLKNFETEQIFLLVDPNSGNFPFEMLDIFRNEKYDFQLNQYNRQIQIASRIPTLDWLYKRNLLSNNIQKPFKTFIMLQEDDSVSQMKQSYDKFFEQNHAKLAQFNVLRANDKLEDSLLINHLKKDQVYMQFSTLTGQLLIQICWPQFRH